MSTGRKNGLGIADTRQPKTPALLYAAATGPYTANYVLYLHTGRTHTINGSLFLVSLRHFCILPHFRIFFLVSFCSFFPGLLLVRCAVVFLLPGARWQAVSSLASPMNFAIFFFQLGFLYLTAV